MPQTNRQYWGKKELPLEQLDLTELQKESYYSFLNNGIREALDEVNGEEGGIQDYTGKSWRLRFGDYRFGEPKYTPTQAKRKNVTYDMPIYVEATLTNVKTGEEQTQEVFLCDLPKMTSTGTFVVNGIERAVVTQLVRSPGSFFSGEDDRKSGNTYHTAEIRPLRGSWIEMTVGKRELITVKIDRRRKMPITTLLRAIGISTDEEIKELFADEITMDEWNLIENSLDKDTTASQEEALLELYEKMRPGEPATLDGSREFLHKTFFDPRRYDLGDVGRYKLNRRLKLDVDDETTVLTKEDIVATVKYLVRLQNGEGKVDDIDHLSNRRVKRIGELVRSGAFRIGLIRLERSIREKMSLTKTEETLTPAALVNARPLIATISEFFRRNRLSTILDQVNPLAEIDNLRRLSVMGTGGVTRERASFSMRDINASQYSRIDPVRSPEGPNIGLVTYLALYTQVNKYGFLEAPYRRVVQEGDKMKVTDEVVYMSADEEEDHQITHASVDVTDDGHLDDEWVAIRYRNEFIEGPVEDVEFIDVVPRQVVGTSASLIPFIAHDEANRALMGTHMQCQAVPLVKPQSPVVGTGMERAVATAMDHSITARLDGTVQYVDANKVVIKLDDSELDRAVELSKENETEYIRYSDETMTYELEKFERTSQSTCYSQRPLVTVGQEVKRGDVIIDGPSSENGELALGANLVVAYSSYEGLGYEDAIVISDRLVQQDLLSSIHVSEHTAQVMDTKLGPEELTNDIPNVSETYLRNLGVDGIIRVGSQVQDGDILIGKIAPKGETELSPEERLLRAIFGEKSREVRDTSLRMPHGQEGVVIDVQILDRDLGDELDTGVLQEVTVKVAQMRKITVGDKLAGRHGNKGVISKIVPMADMPHMDDGTPVDIIISPLSVLARMNLGQLLEAHLGWAAEKLGYKVALPAFEKVDEDRIWDELERAGLPRSGKAQLFDGRTGEPLKEKTVVGIGYILKLVHMIEDKVHARSTGPYSLVTQQPLGGKAQMGGQRMGEMEVWALEAHRAAHTLQEMLTLKSDDVVGRSQAYEAIVKGEEIPAPTVPESFRVLVREMNSLGLDVEAIEAEEVDDDGPTDRPSQPGGDDTASDDEDVDDEEAEPDEDELRDVESEVEDEDLDDVPDEDEVEDTEESKQ